MYTVNYYIFELLLSAFFDVYVARYGIRPCLRVNPVQCVCLDNP